MPPRSTLPWLVVLYFVQGLPMGVQQEAFTIFLRQQGVSRTVLAWLSVLSLPWMLKVLWAPVVDTVYVARLGRRRTWILGLTAIAVPLLLSLGVAFEARALVAVACLLFALNFVVATLDVAVDGLAVETLRDGELGLGNAAQVGGYKLGMLVAGGLALQLLRIANWMAVFAALAALVAVAWSVSFVSAEPPRRWDRAAGLEGARGGTPRPRPLALLRELLASPGGGLLAAVVVLYKAGEAMADTQFKPFLVDHGLRAEDIGLYAGVYGILASTAGSVAGGLVVRSAGSLVTALFAIAGLRILPQLGLVGLAAFGVTHERLVGVTLAEHFAGGMLTTTVFALMMSSAGGAHAGTRFTVLATLEMVGKGTTGFFSGMVADALGDVRTFGVAAGLSCAFLALYPSMRRRERSGAYARDGVDVSADDDAGVAP